MSRNNVWVPVLAGAATVGALAYALTRKSRNARSAQVANDARSLEPAQRGRTVTPRNELRGPLAELDLDGVFEGDSAEPLGLEAVPTAQSTPRVPQPAGADDAEAPSPDDLGAFWLTRAAQSEHSLSEGELLVDIDELSLAVPADGDAIDEGDRLSAEAWRG